MATTLLKHPTRTLGVVFVLTWMAALIWVVQWTSNRRLSQIEQDPAPQVVPLDAVDLAFLDEAVPAGEQIGPALLAMLEQDSSPIPAYPHGRRVAWDGQQLKADPRITLCQFSGQPYQGGPFQNGQTHRPFAGNGNWGVAQPVSAFREHHAAPVSLDYSGTSFGLPWHAFAQGDFVEPPRSPFSPEYRVRVGDALTFIYQVVRTELSAPYRLSVGDIVNIDSDSHNELRQQNLTVMPDGTISVSPLQSEYVAGMTFLELKNHLEARFEESGIREPRITVVPVTIDLPNRDLRDAVDGRAGDGGQQVSVNVTWDGDVWLPSVDAVPVVGLSLREISAEVNARYALAVPGIEVTPLLETPAPSFVYVLGEVNLQGRVEMRRPATALQAITQAGGFLPGANMREVIVLRRTADWQLIATRLNLHDSAFGRGISCDDIWLHDTDIVIVPRSRIERIAELVELYFTRSLYAVLPNQGFSFSYNSDSAIF